MALDSDSELSVARECYFISSENENLLVLFLCFSRNGTRTKYDKIICVGSTSNGTIKPYQIQNIQLK